MSFPEGFKLSELEESRHSPKNSIETCSNSAKGINWAELPCPAVENIYSFLSRTDQSRMSQVCSRWSNEFDSPSLWKKIKFDLPKHDCDSEIYPEVRFARKYGHMFRHVEIVCNEIIPGLVGVTRSQMGHFLEALVTSSQLTSIKFMYLSEYFDYLDDLEDFETYEDMLRVIISFFNSQRNLKKVVFKFTGLRMEYGMKLLKGIFHSDCNTVSSLKLNYFLRYAAESREFSNEYRLNLTEVSRKIVTVRSIAIDYSLMFEDLQDKVAEMLVSGNYQLDKLCLSKIEIYCNNLDEEDEELSILRGIQPRSWSCLKRVLPDLKVKMDIEILSHLTNEMEKYLVREMPLGVLEFRFGETSAATDIRDLITHLQSCAYQNYLESLHFSWLPPIATFAASIIPFVQSCNKLEILHLHAEAMPSEIEGILMELLENHPVSLKLIILQFNKRQESGGDTNLEAISEAYRLLFGSQGMEFFLVVGRYGIERIRSLNIDQIS